MALLLSNVETFFLYYWDECPLKLGDPISSPIIDGAGNTIGFVGDAYISAMNYMQDVGARLEIVAEVDHFMPFGSLALSPSEQ